MHSSLLPNQIRRLSYLYGMDAIFSAATVLLTHVWLDYWTPDPDFQQTIQRFPFAKYYFRYSFLFTLD